MLKSRFSGNGHCGRKIVFRDRNISGRFEKRISGVHVVHLLFVFPAYLVTAEKNGRLNVYKWDSVSKFTLQMVSN